MSRTIIHLDLDAFFCAVEQLRNPDLIAVPFAVGGQPETRGVVASCSYAARMFGIRSAMPMIRAKQLCPQLIVVPPNHKDYQKLSKNVMDYLSQISPIMEQLSIDEAFLDVSDMPDHPDMLASRIQARIKSEFLLPCSLGVAINKLVAKIANDYGKSKNRSANPPSAITIVAPGEEENFLAPLPVIALWGVGPKTSLKLEEMGIRTIGELATMPEDELVFRFGKNGRILARHSKGIDDSPVHTFHEIKSISQETTFSKDITDLFELRQTLKKLCERVGFRLRSERFTARTVKLKLRWYDFTTLTRQFTFARPTNQTKAIYLEADKLLLKNWLDRKPVRLIGVGLSGFETNVRQLGFWDTSIERSQRLQEALDELQNRYGKNSIRRGNL